MSATVKQEQTPPRPTMAMLRCREIQPSDLDGVIDLLTRGFQRHPRDYWTKVIDRLTEHQTPAGFPKYGHLLENAGTPVGVLLLIFTERMIDGVPTIWCNESSYYADPRFRLFASVMVKRLHGYKGVTHLNVTSAPDRWASLEVQGYRRLAEGLFFGVPALAWSRRRVHVYPMTPTFSDRLEPFDFDLLTRHAGYGGCMSLVCEHEGQLYPYVFAIRRRYGVPFAFLIYSKDHSEFGQFAAAIGRYLAKRGVPVVALDTDDRVRGIPGMMTKLRPKFWNGPTQPRLGDLAYTEIPMFEVI